MCSLIQESDTMGFNLSLSFTEKKLIKILANHIYDEINLVSRCIHPALYVFVARHGNPKLVPIL